MNLNTYNIIILDCDGVIFDSNTLKIDAFRETLAVYDNAVVDPFINYFSKNFGTSRYRLAKVFITDFLKQNFDKSLYNTILKSFGGHCLKLYEKSEYTKGLLSFLTEYKDKDIYVASGGDEKELNYVFNKKGLAPYFKEIYGSPTKKTDLVKKIVHQNKNSKVVMLGDAKSDFLASQENGIDFIGVLEYSQIKKEMLNLAKKFGFKTANNLGEVIGE
jgi:HAD superfamily hydrolase (TIGR01549 family)